MSARPFAPLLALLLAASGCAPPPRVVRIRVDPHARSATRFQDPVGSMTLLSGFGPRSGWYHTGIDVRSRAPSDSAVRASKAGTVQKAGWQGRYGKTVVLAHPDGYKTRYAHLAKILVKAGDRVESLQRIGVVGRTGNATGIHLHFEILTPEGRFADPWTLLKGERSPARELP